MSAATKWVITLGGLLLLAGASTYHFQQSSPEVGQEQDNGAQRILTAEVSDSERVSEKRSARLAHWKALTANAAPVERREVASQDNGYLECLEMSRLYREFAKDYSFDELEALRAMALGETSWNQEVIDKMLGDADAVLAQFQKVLEKPDFQLPPLSDGMPDPNWTGPASWFLKFVKQVETENFRRNGEISNAVESALGSLEFTSRLRNADGYLIHELVGIPLSGDGRSMLKKVLLSEEGGLDPRLLEAAAMHLGNERQPLKISRTAFLSEYAAQIEWMGMLIEGTYPKNPEPIELEAPDGSIWGDEEIQQAFDRADLGRLSSLLDLKWGNILHAIENFENVSRQSHFSGDEHSTLESMSPRQLAEFLAETAIPVVGRIGEQAASSSLDQRLMEGWIATERARLDGIEVTTPELLVPRYLKAIPENPFTGEPLGFDGIFFGKDSAGEVQRF